MNYIMKAVLTENDFLHFVLLQNHIVFKLAHASHHMAQGTEEFLRLLNKV